MFQALANRVVSGIISLSMMLLSSYTGNNPSFDSFAIEVNPHDFVFETKIVSAFDNDFEDFFRSSAIIDVFFTITLEENYDVFYTDTFRHSVKYDPLRREFRIYLEEREKEVFTDSYEEMVREISTIVYPYREDVPQAFVLTITSNLPTIRFEGIDKEFDLMMLWKFKQPSLKQTIFVKDYEA
jgi:hypothetical protein